MRMSWVRIPQDAQIFNKEQPKYRINTLYYKIKIMEQDEKKLETKFRIAFGIIILIVLGFALFSCKVEKIDCDAYSQQHMEQTDKKS